MRKSILASLVLAAAALAVSVQAEDLNLSEKPDTVRASLSPYSAGVAMGDIGAINNSLIHQSEQFLKVSIIQSILFGEHWNVGLDLDWLAPGQNWGGELGMDYLIGSGAFKPFLGAGAGVRYFDTGDNFGEGLGPSGTVRAGFLLDVLDELQLRVRIPFHVVANHNADRGIGLDIGLLLSNPLRTTKVKKLKY